MCVYILIIDNSDVKCISSLGCIEQKYPNC